MHWVHSASEAGKSSVVRTLAETGWFCRGAHKIVLCGAALPAEPFRLWSSFRLSSVPIGLYLWAMAGAETYWTEQRAPTLSDFEALARQCFDALPESFRDLAGEVGFVIAEFAENEVLDELDIESPYDLLGLFHGIGMAHAPAVAPTGAMPNRIWLYRRALLDYWAEHDEALGAVVSHVLIHEIGHHFGLSDEDMDAIEAAAD